MGRGPGVLQQKIVRELARQRTKRLRWDELKARFPKEVEQRSFFRAIRGLRRRGFVYDERGGVHHWLALSVLGDDEFLDGCRESIRMLETAARARGVPVPLIPGLVPLSREHRSAGCRRSDVGT